VPSEIAKLLSELQGKSGRDRAALFCLRDCGGAKWASEGNSHRARRRRILDAPRGDRGFGYDPVFYVPELRKGFAEISPEEKNEHSHRGRAFGKLLTFLSYDRVAGQS